MGIALSWQKGGVYAGCNVGCYIRPDGTCVPPEDGAPAGTCKVKSASTKPGREERDISVERSSSSCGPHVAYDFSVVVEADVQQLLEYVALLPPPPYISTLLLLLCGQSHYSVLTCILGLLISSRRLTFAEGNVLYEVSSIEFKPSDRSYTPDPCYATLETPIELWASGRVAMPLVFTPTPSGTAPGTAYNYRLI